MRRLPFLILFYLLPVIANGQVISQRTNSLKVDVAKSSSALYPEVEWINPLRDDTGMEEIKILLEAKISSLDPIKSITIQVHNADDHNPLVRELEVPEDAFLFNLSQNIYLKKGSNTVELIVKSSADGEVKGIRTIYVGKNSNLLDVNRKDYALLIATDIYDNWSDLVNPIYDAETIGDKLEKKYGFQVEILKNPTQEEVILGLRNYSTRQFNKQDQLFIFFAGHGQFDETLGDGYIVTKGSRKNDPSKTSYIAHSNLRQYINNIDCEHIFVAMDVCYGGTFDEKLGATRSIYDNPKDNEWLARKLSIKTRRYLTSGGKEYVPDGTPGSHSPFAKKLVEALNSNGNEDQVLTMAELLVYFERLDIVPYSGSWGDNEPGSDFLFLVAPGSEK